ncbi:hypothetical protein VSX64_20955 [Aurantimonas sp. C2-6-R+9]|uniref:hypothetical protein n=1 Tax=unclassified Aurantimonas TaxID=2638230 RepID=UPI002E176D0C|nr:hypothetical protein [Aurantimonas sp. C2-6-R+9]
MLSDAIRQSRDEFRRAPTALQAAVRAAIPGFDTNLHLWEVSARDLETTVSLLDGLARDVATEAKALTSRQPVVQSLPELARRFGRGDAA